MTLSADLAPYFKNVPEMDLPARPDGRQAAGFDLPIVVINLAHRNDRLALIKERMAKAGLDNLIKAPAIVGAKVPAEQVAALLGSREAADAIHRPPPSHLSLTPPAVGCFLSHLAIWRWVLRLNLPRVLVLEDDAYPAPGYDAGRLREFVTTLPRDAGLVFLGRITMHGLAERPEGRAMARLYYFNGTFAYMITPNGCRALLPHLLPPRMHIDHQMSHALVTLRASFPAFTAEPPFLEPDWSQQSDCYVPITGESAADRELGQIFEANRRQLLAEGRPLLSIG